MNWSRLDDVLGQAGDLSGKVLVSCSMPLNDANTELVIAHTSSGAEELANKAKGARVVSAFHTVPSEVLFGVFDARGNPDRPSLLYSGDDRRAKTVAATSVRAVREVKNEPGGTAMKHLTSKLLLLSLLVLDSARADRAGHTPGAGARPAVQEAPSSSVTHAGSRASSTGPAQHFTGSVRIDPLFQPREPSRVSGALT